MKPALVRGIRKMLVLVIVLVLAAVAVNYLQTWRKRARMVRQAAQILGSDMLRSADSLEYSEYDKGVLRFKLRAQKLLETRKGTSLLEGIEAFDLSPDGSTRSRIRSRRAEYDREGRRAQFLGDVRIQMPDGAELRSESLHYDLNLNLGTSDDSVEFISQEARGRAAGVRYDNAQNTLQLHRDIQFTIQRKVRDAAGGEGTENISVTSQQAFYSRDSRFLRFWGGAHMASDGGELSGDAIEAAFEEGNQRFKSLVCLGNALYLTQTPGGKRKLSGGRMNFLIHPELGNLETIVVEENAGFEYSDETGRQELKAGALQIRMDPVSSRLTGIYARTGVQFQWLRGGEETRLAAENLDAGFSEPLGLLNRLRVWEQAAMETRRQGDAEPETLQAAEIRISLKGESGKSVLEGLEADRSVRWQSPGTKASGGRKGQSARRLTADSLRVSYASGGLPEQGTATGNAELSIVPEARPGGNDIRRLLADAVEVRFFPSEARPSSFRGKGNVRIFYQSRGPAGQEKEIRSFRTSSAAVETSFSAKDGTLEKGTQQGDFRYEDGSRTAVAERCDFDAATNLIVLRGSPRMSDSSGTTSGDLMRLDRKDEVLNVDGHVRSVLRSGKGSGRTPFQSAQGIDSPTIATAATMQYRTKEKHARYQGDVRLLTESGQLQAGVVDLYDDGERIEASDDVRHLIHRQAGGESPGKGAGRPSPGAKRPTQGGSPSNALIRSANLRYLKAGDSIHYSGGVILESSDIWMSSNELDATMNPVSGDLDRAAARGKLQIRQAGREVHGDSGDYFPNQGKFVVIGDLARLSDPLRGKSAARRLTFFTTDDRILLENR